MKNSKEHHSEAQGPTVHNLTARDLVIGPKPKRVTRRKSVRYLIDAAKRAGLTVTGLRPDGSIETAPQGSGYGPCTPEDHRDEDQEANPWHNA